MAQTFLFLNEDTVNRNPGKADWNPTPVALESSLRPAKSTERWNPMFLEVCTSE